MKKQIKKIITIALAAMLCTNAGAFASEIITPQQINQGNEVSPNSLDYYAFLDLSNLLYLASSNGRLYCQGDTHVYSGYTAAVTVELQQYTGSTWDTINTWYSSENSRFAGVSEYYYVPRGTYQLRVIHAAYDSRGSLVEVEISYSDIVTY